MVAIGRLRYFLVSKVNMDETVLVETPPEPPPEVKSESIKEDDGKGSLLFFAKLLETKKQVDRESRAARISNLSIV